MIKTTEHSKAKNKGFTLIEVVFTIGIAAMLLSAISLNLGVKPALQKTANSLPVQETLIERLDEIMIENSMDELIQLVGVSKELNILSDPAVTADRKLVSIDTKLAGNSGDQTSLYAITIVSNSGSVTRWFYP